ncbi:MAG: DUF1266 domain-containing protein [Lachnospiraceae bacterium]|nr:DUF1266 domain-containing protein [Lachnospiraceae bacterium]
MRFMRAWKKRSVTMICMVIMLALAATGCAKKPTYEGGNISVIYDTENWEIAYQDADPYPVICLYEGDDDVIIMLAETDEDMIEDFHDDIVGMFEMEYEVEDIDEVDEWDEEGWFYYEDYIDSKRDSETIYTYYKKAEDDLMIIAIGEVVAEQDEKLETKEEVLEILKSIEYSEVSDIGELEEDDDVSYVTVVYDIVNDLCEYDGKEKSEDSDDVDDDDKDDKEGKDEDDDDKEKKTKKKISPDDLEYTEMITIEDFYGDKSEYDAYVPVGADYEDGFAYYYDHGLSYFSSAINAGGDSFMYEYMQSTVDYSIEAWENADSGYSDVTVGDMEENGDDRYIIMTGMKEDYYGTLFQVSRITYLDMQKKGAGVVWELEIEEAYADEMTSPIVEELAMCYGLDSDDLNVEGSYAEDDAQRIADEQDVYEPIEGDQILEKVKDYQYLGEATLTHESGEVSMPVLVPMGWMTSVSEDTFRSHMHGVGISGRFQQTIGNLMSHTKTDKDVIYKSRKEDEDCRNVTISEMMSIDGFEEALYIVLTYEEKDSVTEEYVNKTRVNGYIELSDKRLFLFEITLEEDEYDDYTNVLLEELETAYGVDLSESYNENAEKPKAGSDNRITVAELMGGEVSESAQVEELPETILWFNATYAPLTYSNGWDWRLVGGLEPTEENKELEQALLVSSWSVYDEETAMEKVKWLEEEGHRATFAECIEELDDMGCLDMNYDEFSEAILEQLSEEDDFTRYVIAYSFYTEGYDEDYIIAWDLCRANQLYADFYLSGYMTYEEAMDASLKNSLILQKKFSSWEEMVDSYMAGYMFWQGDLMMTDDSPTMERYEYYEMLKEKKDGPYTLDWDMKLEKCW